MLRRTLVRLRPMMRSTIGGVFAVNGMILLFGLIGSIQLARWLGPVGRGELAAAMLWPTLLAYLGSLGVIQSVVYHAASPDADTGAVFGTAATLWALQTIAMAGIGYLAMPLLLRSQSDAIVRLSRLYLLIIPVTLLGQYALAIIQARMRFRLFNALRLMLPTGYLIAIIALKLADRLTVPNVVMAHLWLTVALCTAIVVAMFAAGLAPRVRADAGHASQLLRYGVKVHAGTMSQLANTRFDQALIGAWFPPAELGLYVAAVSAANFNPILSNAVDMVLLPRLARSECSQDQSTTLRSVFSHYWILSLGASLLLALAMPVLLPLVFGDGFAAATWPAILLVATAFLVGMKDVLAGGARGMGNPWLGSRAELAAAVATLILVPLLLPVFGIIGAAAGALLASATQLAIVLRGLHRTHGIRLGSLMRGGTVRSAS